MTEKYMTQRIQQNREEKNQRRNAKCMNRMGRENSNSSKYNRRVDKMLGITLYSLGTGMDGPRQLYG